MKHSPAYVMAGLERVFDQTTWPFSVLHFWSDGCAGQFKSKFTTMQLKALAERRDITIRRHYTASGHGKGDHDGQSAVVKHVVKSDSQMPEPTVCVADDLAAACAALVDSKLGKPSECSSTAHEQRRHVSKRVSVVLTAEDIAKHEYTGDAPGKVCSCSSHGQDVPGAGR